MRPDKETFLMQRSRFALAFLLAAGFGVIALTYTVQAGDPKEKPAEPFHDRLLEIARSYKDYGRVDDEYRWAPELCRMPIPAVVRFSASADKDTHGGKLYSLFVEQRNEYLRMEKGAKNSIGQVVVKESWIPEEVTDPTEPRKVIATKARADAKDSDARLAFMGDHFLLYATKDGKTYRAAKQADLFIMFKTDPKTPETDDGWVYGTVTADGKKVTSAGKVASCMKCHQEASHDKLFGLAK
jgi:hypothetical protein